MHSAARRGFLVLASSIAWSCADTDPLDGSYRADTEPSLVLTLEEAGDGGITGTLADPDVAMPLVAHRDGDRVSGVVGAAGQGLPLRAIVEGEQLVVEIGEPDELQRLTFRRSDARPAMPAAAPAIRAPSGQRQVVINEQRLTDEELTQIEATYQIRIPDADYWYDPTLGAWGAKGGPTMGFIPPRLALGGPLQPDASGRGTNVFVNGRELHPSDLAALQQLTGAILPGRYFITSEGFAGFEGGPPQWNLAAMAGPSIGGGGGGDSNTWQSSVTGASGFSDGTTGAVFLPNGGIVSTGQ